MAPVGDLVARYIVCDNGYNGGCYSSKWYSWGRWVVLALAIGLFLIVLLSCLNVARRRRRRGVQPVYGTGWMAPPPGKYQHQQHQMNNYPPQGGNFQQQPGYGGYPPAPPPPPAYGQYQQAQYTGTTFNPNDGYYGTAATGGVQPPQGVYQRGEDYAPPQGPPPGK